MNITVYTTSKCKYCIAAKQWLTSKNYQYQEISLDDAALREDFKSRNPQLRTVPQIFVDGELIGGYQDLVKSRLS